MSGNATSDDRGGEQAALDDRYVAPRTASEKRLHRVAAEVGLAVLWVRWDGPLVNDDCGGCDGGWWVEGTDWCAGGENLQTTVADIHDVAARRATRRIARGTTDG